MPAPGTSGKMPLSRNTVTGVLSRMANTRVRMVSGITASREAAALSAETQLDVLLLWGQGTPAELRATPYETTKTGARLYRVTGTLAQELLDHYAAALYAADSDFSDLPEQEEACVLVME